MIRVFTVDILALLIGNGLKPIKHRATWLGHTTQGIKLSRTVDGRGLLSSGQPGDSIAWSLDTNGFIRKCSSLPFHGECLSLTLLAGILRSIANAQERPIFVSVVFRDP